MSDLSDRAVARVMEVVEGHYQQRGGCLTTLLTVADESPDVLKAALDAALTTLVKREPLFTRYEIEILSEEEALRWEVFQQNPPASGTVFFVVEIHMCEPCTIVRTR